MHLLALVDPVDDTYRRLMNRQLTVQESRHRLARSICHGGRGQIRQAYREDQEDQLAALGLVLNAVVLWNTRYLDAAIAQLRAEGQGTKGEGVARLSPLKGRHINFLGRCLFTIKASGPGQGLRLFRDPDAVADDEDEERRAAHPTCRTVRGGIRPVRSGRCTPAEVAGGDAASYAGDVGTVGHSGRPPGAREAGPRASQAPFLSRRRFRQSHPCVETSYGRKEHLRRGVSPRCSTARWPRPARNESSGAVSFAALRRAVSHSPVDPTSNVSASHHFDAPSTRRRNERVQGHRRSH
ncbi:Tn3 family transposase [Streptomyces hydrogenans]|uniref:Tn3 family transposase n=1 Tax=Streptomyces hydrogenans TaxID=1873719 RepID=UPI0035E1B518